MDEGKSAIEAELDTVEDKKMIALFARQTGRRLGPDTILRILQGKRSRRPRKSRR